MSIKINLNQPKTNLIFDFISEDNDAYDSDEMLIIDKDLGFYLIL